MPPSPSVEGWLASLEHYWEVTEHLLDQTLTEREVCLKDRAILKATRPIRNVGQ